MNRLSEQMVALGSTRSIIRELFEFGKVRAAQVGAENVFDFSIGNPSVPPPAIVTETALDLLKNSDPVALHGYTSAQGDAAVRTAIAGDLTARFGMPYSADDLYLTMGAAAALCCCFKALACPGDEFVVLAPYFPEYKVFIENAGASMTLVPAQPTDFQIDFDALEQAIGPNTKGVVVNSPNNAIPIPNPSPCLVSGWAISWSLRLLQTPSGSMPPWPGRAAPSATSAPPPSSSRWPPGALDVPPT